MLKYQDGGRIKIVDTTTGNTLSTIEDVTMDDKIASLLIPHSNLICAKTNELDLNIYDIYTGELVRTITRLENMDIVLSGISFDGTVLALSDLRFQEFILLNID